MIEHLDIRLALDGSTVITTCDESGCTDVYSLPDHETEPHSSGYSLRPLRRSDFL